MPIQVQCGAHQATGAMIGSKVQERGYGGGGTESYQSSEVDIAVDAHHTRDPAHHAHHTESEVDVTVDAGRGAWT